MEKNTKTRAAAKTGFSWGDKLLRALPGLSCNNLQVSRLQIQRSGGFYREEKVIEAKEAWEKAETMEFDKAAFVDILRKLIGENR